MKGKVIVLAVVLALVLAMGGLPAPVSAQGQGQPPPQPVNIMGPLDAQGNVRVSVSGTVPVTGSVQVSGPVSVTAGSPLPVSGSVQVTATTPLPVTFQQGPGPTQVTIAENLVLQPGYLNRFTSPWLDVKPNRNFKLYGLVVTSPSELVPQVSVSVEESATDLPPGQRYSSVAGLGGWQGTMLIPPPLPPAPPGPMSPWTSVSSFWGLFSRIRVVAVNTTSIPNPMPPPLGSPTPVTISLYLLMAKD